MFAGQKPDPIWPQALAPDHDRVARSTEPVGAKSNADAAGAVRSRAVTVVLGIGLALSALILIVLAGSLASRQADAPNKSATLPAQGLAATTPAALPPPASVLPPLAEAPPDSRGQIIEPEPLMAPEPPPIEIGVSPQASPAAAPPRLSTVIASPARVSPPQPRDAAAPYGAVPLPPSRPLEFAPAPSMIPMTSYDKWTAVYDISAHTVYLPDGMRLEAHSGLGDRMDDPRFVDEPDRGPTPPHLYELTLRESLFHGVQALRLTPIGGGFSFNRVGLLAHPYMLGPNGDSNGCVSFKYYDVFLRAFTSGEVKRLAVVARWPGDLGQIGRLASLRPGVDH